MRPDAERAAFVGGGDEPEQQLRAGVVERGARARQDRAVRAGRRRVRPREYGWSEAAKFGRLALQALPSVPGLPAETVVRVRLLVAKGELEGGVSGEPVDHVQAAVDALTPAVPMLGEVPPALVVEAYLTLGTLGRLAAIRAVVTDFQANDYVRTAIGIAERAGDKRALAQARVRVRQGAGGHRATRRGGIRVRAGRRRVRPQPALPSSRDS